MYLFPILLIMTLVMLWSDVMTFTELKFNVGLNDIKQGITVHAFKIDICVMKGDM